MTDILDSEEAGSRVLRGGVLRVIGFVAGVGLSVWGVALVTRHLGPVDYGRFQKVFALAAIVQAVTDLGMTSLGLREYVQRKGADRERFLRTLLGLRIVLTCAGAGLAVACGALLGYDGQMLVGAALMGVAVTVGMVAGTLGIPLAAELRNGWVTGIDLLRQGTQTLLYVMLTVVGAGFVWLLASAIPVYLTVALVTLAVVGTAKIGRPIFDLREWSALIRPTLMFALASTVGMIYVYMALLICGQVADAHEIGLFAVAFRVYAIVAAVPVILVTTAFPLLSRAARDDNQRLAYASQRLFEGTALLGGAVLIGCVLAAAPAQQVISDARYTGAVAPLRIIGVALALSCVIATFGFTLLAQHHHRLMVAANAAALIVSAVTVALLARRHGATGAAFGTLLGEVTLAAGYALGVARSGPGMRPRLARVLRLLPIVILALCCGLLPLPAIVSTALALALYALLALAFGAVPPEAREHLPRPLARFGLGGADT